ncbi:unnamed protein product [Darwinula stevensoni]|uniref:Death domain-containing protein n=1 Tax=Darwinula stevensoni TaxID=69355 RepID=A0A7R8X6C5_9CRUS|nr:unnamed protein product [Darwinula stevensoni]CAG0881325.1 unnamed protein product [Darwinula stevensoni]
MDVDRVFALHIHDLEYIDIDEILKDLLKKGMLKNGEYYEVAKKSSSEKRLFLTERILHKGEDAFPTFLTCLRERNHSKLADEMDRDRSELLKSPRDIIRARKDFLMDHLDVDRVAMDLFESGVLTSGDRDEVTALRELTQRRTVLLAKLLAKIDSRNFEMLLKALVTAGQSDVSKDLRTQWEAVDKGKPDLAISLLSEMPSDDDIWEMAGKLQDIWEKLGEKLGVCQEKLEEIKKLRNSLQDTTYSVLREWRKSSPPGRYTFGALREALQELGLKRKADEIIDVICRKKCDEVKGSI